MHRCESPSHRSNSTTAGRPRVGSAKGLRGGRGGGGEEDDDATTKEENSKGRKQQKREILFFEKNYFQNFLTFWLSYSTYSIYTGSGTQQVNFMEKFCVKAGI